MEKVIFLIIASVMLTGAVAAIALTRDSSGVSVRVIRQSELGMYDTLVDTIRYMVRQGSCVNVEYKDRIRGGETICLPSGRVEVIR